MFVEQEHVLTLRLLPEQATAIAEGVVTGSARLLEEDDRDAAALRKAVTSPNGTTQAALEVLMDEDSGFPNLLPRAVKAATDRSKELARDG